MTNNMPHLAPLRLCCPLHMPFAPYTSPPARHVPPIAPVTCGHTSLGVCVAPGQDRNPGESKKVKQAESLYVEPQDHHPHHRSQAPRPFGRRIPSSEKWQLEKATVCSKSNICGQWQFITLYNTMLPAPQAFSQARSSLRGCALVALSMQVRLSSERRARDLSRASRVAGGWNRPRADMKRLIQASPARLDIDPSTLPHTGSANRLPLSTLQIARGSVCWRQSVGECGGALARTWYNISRKNPSTRPFVECPQSQRLARNGPRQSIGTASLGCTKLDMRLERIDSAL